MIPKSLFLLALLAAPAVAGASHLEVSRLAGLLEHASANLAFGVRSVQGFNNVEHHAERLSVTAERLLDSINRGRTSAYLRIRFTDVTRYYQRLEAAYLRTSNRRGLDQIHDQFGYVAGVYENLRLAFYGDTYNTGYLVDPQVYIYVPGHRGNPYYPRYDIPRNYNDRDRDRNDPSRPEYGGSRNDHDSTVQDRQRRRDYNDRGLSQGRQPNQDSDQRSRVEDRQLRQGYNERGLAEGRQPFQNYDHRSSVAERQRRQEFERRDTAERNGRGTAGNSLSSDRRNTRQQSGSRSSDRRVANQGYTRLGGD